MSKHIVCIPLLASYIHEARMLLIAGDIEGAHEVLEAAAGQFDDVVYAEGVAIYEKAEADSSEFLIVDEQKGKA